MTIGEVGTGSEELTELPGKVGDLVVSDVRGVYKRVPMDTATSGFAGENAWCNFLGTNKINAETEGGEKVKYFEVLSCILESKETAGEWEFYLGRHRELAAKLSVQVKTAN